MTPEFAQPAELGGDNTPLDDVYYESPLPKTATEELHDVLRKTLEIAELQLAQIFTTREGKFREEIISLNSRLQVMTLENKRLADLYSQAVQKSVPPIKGPDMLARDYHREGANLPYAPPTVSAGVSLNLDLTSTSTRASETGALDTSAADTGGSAPSKCEPHEPPSKCRSSRLFRGFGRMLPLVGKKQLTWSEVPDEGGAPEVERKLSGDSALGALPRVGAEAPNSRAVDLSQDTPRSKGSLTEAPPMLDGSAAKMPAAGPWRSVYNHTCAEGQGTPSDDDDSDEKRFGVSCSSIKKHPTSSMAGDDDDTNDTATPSEESGPVRRHLRKDVLMQLERCAVQVASGLELTKQMTGPDVPDDIGAPEVERHLSGDLERHDVEAAVGRPPGEQHEESSSQSTTSKSSQSEASAAAPSGGKRRQPTPEMAGQAAPKTSPRGKRTAWSARRFASAVSPKALQNAFKSKEPEML